MSFASFAGKTAIVTGASSGIGAAIARALRARGALVHAIARHPGDGDFLWAPLDLEDDAAIGAFTGAFAGPLDILVHGAGLLTSGPVATTPIAEADRQHQVNLRAPWLLTQGLLPALLSAKGQVVFLNSSIFGNARGGLAGYAASKYALKALADALRAEINPDGARVLSVFPGKTASRMQAGIHAAQGTPYQPEALLQPGDIADMVLATLALPATAEVTDLRIRPAHKTG